MRILPYKSANVKRQFARTSAKYQEFLTQPRSDCVAEFAKIQPVSLFSEFLRIQLQVYSGASH